jgi:hypothetical protein
VGRVRRNPGHDRLLRLAVDAIHEGVGRSPVVSAGSGQEALGKLSTVVFQEFRRPVEGGLIGSGEGTLRRDWGRWRDD